MRTGNSPSRREAKRKNSNRRPHSSSGWSPPPNALSLPAIGRGVKGRYEFHFDAQKWAKVALQWLKKGELADVTGNISARQLAEMGISNWVNRNCAGLTHLYGFSCSAITDADAEEWQLASGRDIEADDAWLFITVWDHSNTYFIKDRILEIDHQCPGLGHAVMSVMERVSYQTHQLYTATLARHHASHIYWYGMDHQKDFLEEAAFSEEEIDLDEYPTPDWFDGYYKKAFTSLGNELAPQEIAVTAKEHPNAGIREIAQLLQDMSDMKEQGAKLPNMCGTEYESVYSSAIIRWDQDDPISRVMDDWFDYVNAGADYYTDAFGIEAVPLDPRGFQEWTERTELGFALLTKLDRLIEMVAVPSIQGE